LAIYIFCFFLNYYNNVIINVWHNLHSNLSFKRVIYFVTFQLSKPTYVYYKHTQRCKNSDTTPKIILLSSPGVLKYRILIKPLKVYLRNITNFFIPKYRNCNCNSFLAIQQN
jgi:hypothetical protein